MPELNEPAGLSINEAKTDLVCFGTSINPINVNGISVSSSSSLKFLGLSIQQDLRFNIHTDRLCSCIRSAAGRIRASGGHLGVWDRKTLFSGWIRGIINSNALAYLPLLSHANLKKLDIAYNAGVRAVVGLPKRGFANLGAIRQRLQITSISQIKKQVLLMAAWKRRKSFLNPIPGPSTRSRTLKNIPLPSLKGNRIFSHIARAWNELPVSIKTNVNKASVNNWIKNYILNC